MAPQIAGHLPRTPLLLEQRAHPPRAVRAIPATVARQLPEDRAAVPTQDPGIACEGLELATVGKEQGLRIASRRGLCYVDHTSRLGQVEEGGEETHASSRIART